MTAHRPGPYCAIHDAAHPPCDPGPVISSDAPIVLSPDDADRVAALLEERPGPTEAMRALFAERRPVAGWVEHAANFYLAAGSEVFARVNPSGAWALYRGQWTVKAWECVAFATITAWKKAPSIVAAQLAAEDALRAIAAEILRAVGK